MRGSEGTPWSRPGRLRWSKESELELELSPGSRRTICLGGILPGRGTTQQASEPRPAYRSTAGLELYPNMHSGLVWETRATVN